MRTRLARVKLTALRRWLEPLARWALPARWVRLAMLALLVAVPPRPAAAHELGMFQVFGTFERDGTFRLLIKVDQEHLPAGRQGGPARPTRYGAIRGLSGPAEQLFGRFMCDLADALTLRFDGRPFAPVLVVDPQDARDALQTGRLALRAEGWIPAGARSFTLTSALPGKPYPLVLNNEGDDVSVWKWVDSRAVSPPFALAAAMAPPPAGTLLRRFARRGIASVLPHGPAALLLVGALFLLARRPPAAAAQLAALTLAQAAGLALALSGAMAASPAWTGPCLALAIAGLALASLPIAAGDLPATDLSGAAGPAGAPAPRRMRTAGLALLVLPAGVLYGLAAVPAFPSAAAPADSILAGHAPPWLVPAVAGWSLGTLAAELAVTAGALALIGLPLGRRPWYRSRVVVPAGCLIAVVSLYWSVSGVL